MPETDLLSPLTIRGVELRNRIVMSPMCQYSAEEGMAHDWHLVHLGSRAVGGASLIIAEATAVTRDGRISPADLGLWTDEHAEPLARIARFVHSQGAVAGVDLIDVSSGGAVPKARIPVAKGYQVPFAQRIRAEACIRTGAVGLITEPQDADEIITGGEVDLVFLGRELLREPYWALKAQHALGEEPSWPIPYGYAVKRRAK